MAIPRNKNLTKQLNSYSYVIAITLQDLLQRTKQALNWNPINLIDWYQPIESISGPLAHENFHSGGI